MDQLDELLGIDPRDPKATAEAEDAEALMRLVECLVLHRKTAGLTQKAVAEYMETTQSAVSEFERLGGDPRLSTIQRYARAVGLPLRLPQMLPVEPAGAWTTVATVRVAPQGAPDVTRAQRPGPCEAPGGQALRGAW